MERENEANFRRVGRWREDRGERRESERGHSRSATQDKWGALCVWLILFPTRSG